MDFLTTELLGFEETFHWKSELTKHESIWLDGRLTAGEHAALVKQNHQLDPSSPLAKLIAENVEQKIIASPLLKSFALIRKVHSILISRSEAGDRYGWHVDNPFSKYGRRDISFTLFLSDLSDYEGGGAHISALAGFEGDPASCWTYHSISELVIALCKACRKWRTIGLCWMD